jgi:hypothetical protein
VKCEDSRGELVNSSHLRELQDKMKAEGSTPGLSNAAPVISFPGALFYSAGFNVYQNFKKKIFLNNSMFPFFFRSTPMNTVFPLLQFLFSFVPILLPPNPTLSFFTGESAGISRHLFKQITHLSRFCFEGPVTIIVGVS